MVTKDNDYIVKACDCSFEKKVNLRKLFGLYIILFIGIVWFYFRNFDPQMLQYIKIMGVIGSIIVLTYEKSIVIKDRKICIKKYFLKYKIDYSDLVKVRCEEMHSSSRTTTMIYYHYYLVIDYIKNNKLKEVVIELDEKEIEEICESFITKNDLEMGFYNDYKNKYFDINRDISDEELDELVLKKYNNNIMIIVMTVLIGIAIMTIIIYNYYLSFQV